jgi:fructose-specific phosphotransferase system IIC component
MMYSKSETQQVAAYSGAAGSLLTTGCSILAGAIGGLVCGFAAGYAGGVAQQALNQGKCVGMRAMIYVPQPTTHLVIEKC